MNRPLRLACFISGGGRTMINLAEWIERGELPARIEIVVSSRSDVVGVERAWQRDLDVRFARQRDYDSLDAMHDDVYHWLNEYSIDLVCLCGYVKWLRIDPEWRGRIINIHPALLPRHGGPGMYGHHVHQAVLDAGERFSGCTVHFVDDHYDHGPMILQRVCPVLPDDDEKTLAARVFAQECLAYPQALNMIAEQRVVLRDNRAVIYAEPVAASH